MMKSALGMLCIGAILACVPAAVAAPVVFDGTIDAQDHYVANIGDPLEGGFGSSSFEINSVKFDIDPTWFYIGLETVGAFDRNGGDFAMPPKTSFAFVLDNLYSFFLTTTATTMTLETPSGVVAPGDWEASIGGSLELRIKSTLLTALNVNDFAFYGRLDNSDAPPDDIVSGRAPVPEPATLALLAVGGLLVATRRRRRQ